ncbi:MAG TPA: amidohydrolase family protein [Acidobacteriota bacterium]
MTWDVVIKDAAILDGTGRAAFQGDIRISGDRIDSISKTVTPASAVTVNAAGKYVAPGFIDIHTHADLIHPLEHETQFRLLECKLRQGITTEITGNCGLGIFPLEAHSEPLIRGILAWMTPCEYSWPWHSTAGYLQNLEQRGTLLNIGVLQPHGPLRLAAMGLTHGSADAAALGKMISALERSFDEGAFGLSTGLIYPPGMFTPTAELEALAKVAAANDAIVTNHIRGSSETLLDAVAEILSLADATGAHIHHSHNEAVGRRHWWKIHRVLDMEAEANRKGNRVTFDMFPYFGAATMMLAIYPPWSLEGGLSQLLLRLQDPAVRSRIRNDVENVVPQWPPWTKDGWPHNLVRATGWDQIYIGSIDDRSLSRFEGMSLQTLGRELGKDPFDAISDLMIEARGQISQIIFEISGAEGEESHMEELVRHPLGAFATDANDYGKGKPHPASYGGFARILQRFVRERGVLTLEEAIRKMTSYPADLMKIRNRGRIAAGYFADLVLFEPDKVVAPADFSDPRRFSSGITDVWINGKAVLREGRYQPVPAGRVLRSRKW